MKNIQPGDRVGLFGGTFNPIHAGHLAAIAAVKPRLKLDWVSVIPAAQSPRKAPVDGPTSEQRLKLIDLALQTLSDDAVFVDNQELERGGLSYTVDTVKAYAKIIAPEDLFLVVGMDQLEEFDKWKQFESILGLANLVVLTRPHLEIPHTIEDLPAGLRPLVADFDRSFCALNSGRTIEFIRLAGNDVSSSEVRKRLRTGRSVEKFLPLKVEEYIKKAELYGPLSTKIGDFESFARFCGRVLFERKGLNVRGFDLRQAAAPSEYTLIASGTSTRHASSLAENVMRAVKDEFNVLPQSTEGLSEGRWVLVDYGGLIVHVFYDFIRNEYRLEDLWKEGRDLGLVDEAPDTSSRKK